MKRQEAHTAAKTHHIKVEAPLSRAEKIRVLTGTAALGAVALAGTAGLVGRGGEQAPPTHEETVSVTFGDEASTNIGMARHLRNELGATESVAELVDELRAVEPGEGSQVQQGQDVTVTIDVPNK